MPPRGLTGEHALARAVGGLAVISAWVTAAPGLGPADGPPLDPGRAEARRWLAEELTKQKYHVDEGLWDRFLRWLREMLDLGGNSGLGVPQWVTGIVVLLLLLGAALLIARVVRREPRAPRQGGHAVLEEPGAEAKEYRRRAQGALADADWDGAVLDAFRAVAQGAVERTVLDDLPGRTADEVARDLGPVFPPEAEDLRRAAVAFDAVRYGHLSASEESARACVDVESRVRRSRPVLPGLAGALDLAVPTNGPSR